MTDYSFPLASYRHLVERIESPPSGVNQRRWVIRDDNEQHYHGRISLDEDPLYLELAWKADARSQEQLVGHYRLHLAELLDADYVRKESDRPDENDIRLRFYRGDRGVVYIQRRNDRRGLAVGTVDRSLG